MNLPGFSFTVPQEQRWTRLAACADQDAPYMFPHEQDLDGIDDAKALCRACPVRERCLSEALDRNEGFGIWGGLTSAERRASKRKAARNRTGGN